MDGDIDWYWTRTPSPDSSYSVYSVYCDGTFNYWDYAFRGDYGVVPALYLKSNVCKPDLEIQEYTMDELVKKIGHDFKIIK